MSRQRIELGVLRVLRKLRLVGARRVSELSGYVLVENSPFFDGEWYLRAYPDVARAQVDPVWHYLNRGWREGRLPSPEFDGADYLRRYRDVARAGANPLVHFLTRGAVERRAARPAARFCSIGRIVDVLRRPGDGWLSTDGKTLVGKAGFRSDVEALEESPLLDAEWYARTYGDGLRSESAAVHYLVKGWIRGFHPSPEFDGATYVKNNPDAAGRNPLLHYLKVGKSERRRISPVRKLCDDNRVRHLVTRSPLFDAEWYARQDPTLAGMDAEGLAGHYLSVGWKRGLDPSPRFRTGDYLELNGDVKRANVCPLRHYLLFGCHEGRRYRMERASEEQKTRDALARDKAMRTRMANGRKTHRRILLVSHEFSYTGAPLSLLKAAQCYRAAGYRIVTVTLKDGPLASEFRKCGKTVVFSSNAELAKLSVTCDIAIVNTLVAHGVYEYLCPLLPTVWWVREPVAMLSRSGDMMRAFMSGENVYAMSDYSAGTFRDLNPGIRVIRHGMEDAYRGVRVSTDRIVFAVIGTIQDRKGQDLFVEAVKGMDPELRSRARFLIVGRALSDRYEAELRRNAGGAVEFVGDVDDFGKMLKFYEGIACAVIPSREEPTSRVAIEAMMMGRAVIMSDHTGARYLVNDANGMVFESENVGQLRACMEKLIRGRDRLPQMELAAREAYRKFNSIPVYAGALMRTVEDAMKSYEEGYGKLLAAFTAMRSRPPRPSARPPTLSVVIPVYNALEFVERLVASLDAARFSKETEIIFVDDCSEEETARYLKKEVRRHGWQLVRNDVNSGFIKTCNRGMRIARGDVVVLLNSDTLVPPEFERKFKECFGFDEGIACACPVAVHSGWFDFPFDDGETFYRAASRLAATSARDYPLFTPEGFCIAFRKQALKEVGLLDEVFGMGYCEEDDLVMRLIRKGYRTVLVHDLLVYHRRHASFSSERRKLLFEGNRKIFHGRYGNQQRLVRELMGCADTVKRISAAVLGEKDNGGDAA